MANANVSDPGKFEVSARLRTFMYACLFFGLVGSIWGLTKNQDRFWTSYLIGFFYFTSLALGGLFFTAIQHVTKAGWSVNIRRLVEAFTTFLPIAAIGAIVLYIGGHHLYEWFDKAKVAEDALLSHKSAYLNSQFFGIRLLAFFAIWVLFSRLMVSGSVAQDKSGDYKITLSQVKYGVIFLLLFAITYSLFSVDLVMSVQPHWFSTIFGIYCFAGLFQSTMAFLILTILYLQRKGLLSGFVTSDHLHDLGKFLFAFTVFWAYIAFSQYMLIWYANLPEETGFIISRTEGAWLPMSLLLLVGKFIVPFLALLPRWAKRAPAHLAVVSLWILVMQYADLYWLIYPAYHADSVPFSLYEIFVFLGFLGLFLMSVTRFLSKNNLVPIKDPRIHESMHHHVVY